METNNKKKSAEKQFQESIVRDYIEETKDTQPTEEKFKKWLQQKGEDYINKKRKQFMQKAAHGVKLEYIKELSHKCGPDEELYYFKKGGVVDCGCRGKKMEEGGKTEKETTVDKFKNRKKPEVKKGERVAGFKRFKEGKRINIK